MMKRILFSAVILSTTLAVLAEEAAPAFPKFTPTGFVQYRFRTVIKTAVPDTGKSTGSVDCFNQIGYFIGAKSALSDQFSVELQIGNDFMASESIDWGTTNRFQNKGGISPYFSLAYLRWNPGVVAINAGIVPVKSYGTLDLLETSLRSDSATYNNPSFLGWNSVTNNSLAAFTVEVPILKGETKLGINATTSIYKTRKQGLALSDDRVKATNAIFEIIDIPFATGPLTFTPQVAVVFNRWFKADKDNEKGSPEIGAGFATSFKAGKALSLRGSYAYARNNRHVIDSNFITVGTLAGLGVDVAIGSHKITYDGKLNIAKKDIAAKMGRTTNFFSDLRYEYAINKYFSCGPRIRTFTQFAPQSSTQLYSAEIRPEIILTGKF